MLWKNTASRTSKRAVSAAWQRRQLQIDAKMAVFPRGMTGASQTPVNVSLYQAAAAMNANARWQEAISENLASSSIPGFKKQNLSFDAIQAGVMPQANLDPSMRFTIPRAKSATSFVQGQLRPTGINTDVAIDGKGFFEVQLPNGTTAYTRDGEFQINSLGQLSNKQGSLVLGESGPIQLDRNNSAPLSISASGEVSQAGEVKGKLKIVEFNQPNLLTQISGGFIATDPNLQPTEVSQPALRQGFLESANTTPVTEMASLISVMRSFEANQRVIQIQDERMGRAISELGNPT
jgi:flagellar basal-body rod protein FlgF